MQQTVDVVVLTKDQTDADVDLDLDLATILVSGLSCFSYAVEEMAADLIAVDVEMTAYGLSSCYSSAVDVEVLEVDVVAVATIAATKMRFPQQSFCPSGRSFTYFPLLFHIFF